MTLGNTILFKNALNDKINSMLAIDSIYKITCFYGDLECDCLEFNFNQNSEIPTYPLDSNSVASDNVLMGLDSISCKLYVSHEKIIDFQDLLEKGNLHEYGFTIVTLSRTFISMFWTYNSYSETSDNVGGVIYDLNFLQVKFVEPRTAFISYKKTKPKYASAERQGKVQPRNRDEARKNASLLKQGLNFLNK